METERPTGGGWEVGGGDLLSVCLHLQLRGEGGFPVDLSVVTLSGGGA